MREELSIDMDTGEEHHPYMLFINSEELQKLWHNMSAVQWHGQQTLLTAPQSRICKTYTHKAVAGVHLDHIQLKHEPHPSLSDLKSD